MPRARPDSGGATKGVTFELSDNSGCFLVKNGKGHIIKVTITMTFIEMLSTKKIFLNLKHLAEQGGVHSEPLWKQ